MHICFVTHEYPKQGFSHGGIGTFIQTIGRGLVKNKHQVTVIGINGYACDYEEENDQGVTVYRLKPKKIKGVTWWLNSRKVNAHIKKIHAKTPISIIETPELGLAFIKKIPSIKYIIRLHGGHHFFSEAENRGIHKWKGFQEKRSFKKADAFIAVSNYVKTHTAKYLNYCNKKVAVINSPVNLEVFTPKVDVEIDNNTILFAGTICEKKGVRHLILAMSEVIETYPNIELHMYGRDWFFKDGRSYIQYLKEEVLPELGSLSKNIVFKGVIPIEELALKYASSTLCVFPSLMETQGLVAQEAMAMNKLVIFSELGPGPEAIEDGVTGLLCNPYDIKSIAKAIKRGLENEEERQIIADKAASYAREKYNINTLLNKNLEFYKSII